MEPTKWYERAKLVNVVTVDESVKLLHSEAGPGEDSEEFLLVKAATPVPVEEANLGFGCNTFSGDVRGRALIAEDALIDSGIQGSETTFNLHLIKSKHELNEKMEVGASASYSAGLFSASAKSKFVKEQKVNRESTYLLVKVLVTNSKTHFKEYKPSKEFTEFIAKDPIDWNRFLIKYGTGFIFQIVTGGEFYALYEFQTKSIEQKNSIEVQVSGGYAGFSAGAAFKQAMDNIHTDVDITCTLYTNGGKGKLPQIDGPSIIKAALDFPVSVNPKDGAPVAYQAFAKDYDVVDDFPGYPDDIQEKLDKNKEICDNVTELLVRVEDLEQSLEMQRVLDPMTKNELNDIKEDLINEMKEITEEPLSIHADPTPPLIDKIDKIDAEKVWTMMPGKLTQISVGRDVLYGCHVWGVNASRQIWRWNKDQNNWEMIAGSLTNVSVGADGTTWGVNHKQHIFRWDNNWTRIKGRLKQISVGSKDYVWGINSKGQVFQWENQHWVLRTTGFNLLSVGSDGTVVLLKENRQVFKWNKDEASFEPINGELSHITVGNASQIWGIDSKGQVVKWDGETWKPLSSTRKLKSISVGDDGTVWGVDGQDNIFRFTIVEDLV